MTKNGRQNGVISLRKNGYEPIGFLFVGREKSQEIALGRPVKDGSAWLMQTAAITDWIDTPGLGMLIALLP
ncbi:hypothetical protein ACVW0Y_004601 [Pseudomonas sp. TE3786]